MGPRVGADGCGKSRHHWSTLLLTPWSSVLPEKLNDIVTQLKKKAKLSRYRPEQALGDPVG